MRREFLFGAVMAAAVAVGASAQSTSPTSQNPNNQAPTSQSPTPQSPTTQSPQSPTTQGTGSASSDYQSGETVTLSGCLASADTWKGGTAATGTTGSPTGTTGAPGSTSASRSSGSGGFVLTDASIGGGSSSSSYGAGANPSATGTGGASSSADKDAYMLQGKDDDLQKYVNHRVEVRGRLDKSKAADTSMTNPPSTGSTSAPGTKGTLTVSSVQEISGSCSGGGNR